MDIYSEIILDHFKNPKNHGKLENPDKSATLKNTSCGDIINIDLNIKNGKINEIKFSGQGCAISQATCSLLTEKIKGLSPEEILKLDEKYIKDLVKIDISIGRIKCALIGLETIKKALSEK